MHIKEIENDVKDKEWKPKEEWAPIKFNEDKVKDEVVKKAKEAEKTADVAKTPEKAEQELQDAEAPIPNEENPSEENPQEETTDTTETEEDDEEVKPIMLLIYGYGKDLANADKNGPRKDPYSMKGLFKTCEFMTIKGGTSKENLAKLFGEILHEQVVELYNVLSYKPCNDKNELDEKAKNEVERPELANLTNTEATSLIKDKKKGADLVKIGASKVSAAETPEEKKQLKKLHDMNNDAIEGDKELQDKIKEINPDLVDENGNLNKEEWDRTNDMLSEYQLSKHKEKSHKGFFGRMWDAIKKFFGGSSDSKSHQYTNDELEKITKLIAEKIKKNQNNEQANESLETIFNAHKSLSQYIAERRNK